MEFEDIIGKIKEKGYWEVNIHPNDYKEDLLSEENLETMIQELKVSLRGWDYPHIGETNRLINSIESANSWEHFIEFWRFTSSGNFFHLLGLREDWLTNREYNNMWSKENIINKKVLGILGALYSITEIYELAKRLVSKINYQGNIIIDVKLHDLKNRELLVDSFNRTPFFSPKQAKIDIWSNRKKEFTSQEILEQSSELALKDYINLMYYFKWDNPPLDSLKNDQEKFLTGRI